MANTEAPAQGNAAAEKIRGEAIREAAEHLDHILKSGLVAKFYVLGEMGAIASRMERGMNARGNVVQRAGGHHDADDDDLSAAFEQIREEYDDYRHAVRVGVQRVRDMVASSDVPTAPEVIEALACIGVPPKLVPTQLLSLARFGVTGADLKGTNDER